jgi:hypothetical protein
MVPPVMEAIETVSGHGASYVGNVLEMKTSDGRGVPEADRAATKEGCRIAQAGRR